MTRRNFSFGDKEFEVTLPLFKCLAKTTSTTIFRRTGLSKRTCSKFLSDGSEVVGWRLRTSVSFYKHVVDAKYLKNQQPRIMTLLDVALGR